MRVLIVVSDQHENFAVVGGSEGALVEPIGKAAVADLKARGHEAWYYDPQKSWSLYAPMVTHRPGVVVFVHINGGASTAKMKMMCVDCSHKPNSIWSGDIARSMSAAMPLFPYGGVYTDFALRGFCFWFYKRLRRLLFTGKRTVLEMGNMKNLQQATYLRDNPVHVGQAISRAVAPVATNVPLPLLQYPATAPQPGVRISGRYYVDDGAGAPVAWLQRALNAHYDGKHGHAGLIPLAVDGWYGQRTATRLLAFQRDHWYWGVALPVTGRTDERTWKKLKSVTA